MKLTKDSVTKMIEKAGMSQEKREPFMGFDIFVCDGFSAHPDVTYKRFGAEPGDFSYGAYCTIWFAAKGEENFEIGRPILFDGMHDSGWTPEQKKRGRVAKAVEDAKKHIEWRFNA